MSALVQRQRLVGELLLGNLPEDSVTFASTERYNAT